MIIFIRKNITGKAISVNESEMLKMTGKWSQFSATMIADFFIWGYRT